MVFKLTVYRLAPAKLVAFVCGDSQSLRLLSMLSVSPDRYFIAVSLSISSLFLTTHAKASAWSGNIYLPLSFAMCSPKRRSFIPSNVSIEQGADTYVLPKMPFILGAWHMLSINLSAF